MIKAIFLFILSAYIVIHTIIDSMDLTMHVPSRGSTGSFVSFDTNPLLFSFVFLILVGTFSYTTVLSVYLFKNQYELQKLVKKHDERKKTTQR